MPLRRSQDSESILHNDHNYARTNTSSSTVTGLGITQIPYVSPPVARPVRSRIAHRLPGNSRVIRASRQPYITPNVPVGGWNRVFMPIQPAPPTHSWDYVGTVRPSFMMPRTMLENPTVTPRSGYNPWATLPLPFSVPERLAPGSPWLPDPIGPEPPRAQPVLSSDPVQDSLSLTSNSQDSDEETVFDLDNPPYWSTNTM